VRNAIPDGGEARLTVLVAGATGQVGREVVVALQAMGETPRVLLRDPSRWELLPGEVEVSIGDLADPLSLDTALAGVEEVFFTSPHDPSEVELGMNVLEACRRAGVRRLVLSTAIHPDAGPAWLRNLIFRGVCLMGPHYRSKLTVEARVRDSDLESVVLQPSNFFQNDELFRDEVLAGFYPWPLGRRGASRVDTRDVGRAAALALRGEIRPGVYPLVGPTLRITGPDAAAAWTEVLHREVAYAGDDLDEWEQRIGDRMTGRKRTDFRKTYALIQRFGFPATDRHLARTREALGGEPRSYHDYVRECAAAWV